MKKDILIIGAMEDVELNYLKCILKNSKRIEYRSFVFYEGELFGKNVVLCISNIGLINAGMACVIAIERYNPRIIINEGLARRIYKRYKKRGYSDRDRSY